MGGDEKTDIQDTHRERECKKERISACAGVKGACV
jgi:hypothetical protein